MLTRRFERGRNNRDDEPRSAGWTEGGLCGCAGRRPRAPGSAACGASVYIAGTLGSGGGATPANQMKTAAVRCWFSWSVVEQRGERPRRVTRVRHAGPGHGEDNLLTPPSASPVRPAG
ncbi:hypothetical protein EYF80_065198 [Liparis tanakae]|uniref:Uncharacterized protein n=1 Tax=Liparis tanakae TaxID=230148 RepID=A0A4Z2E6X4_9TELE|nr:hypothetical protein EYF80_065198 [Liparis tanakae]